MLRLLGRTSSNNVQKVLWLLDELNLAHEQEDCGGPFGKNRTPAYLQMNPNGTVPTLIDGDTVVWESNTILRYLAGKSGSALYPADLARRAEVDQWMDWQLGTLAPAFRPLYIGLVRDGRTLDTLTDQHAAAGKLFAILDAALAAREYITGTAMTLADLAIGPMLYRWHALKLASENTVHLNRWLNRLCDRPAFQGRVMVALA